MAKKPSNLEEAKRCAMQARLTYTLRLAEKQDHSAIYRAKEAWVEAESILAAFEFETQPPDVRFDLLVELYKSVFVRRKP